MLAVLLIIGFLNGPDTLSAVVGSIAPVCTDGSSMTLRADGRLVIADRTQNNVVVLDAGDKRGKSVGGKGWGSEALNAPEDVSTSFLLDIFVTDRHNRRVQRYDKDLRFIQTFDETFASSFGTMLPVSTAVTSFGDVLILDEDGNRVLQWSPHTGAVHEFGGAATAMGGLREPKDIAVGSEDAAFVLDGSRIVSFDRFGNPLATTPLPQKNLWKTIAADGNRIAVTSDDRILFIDRVSGEQHLLLRTYLLGALVTEPFSDIVLRNDQLLLLTATTFYRCTLVMP